MPVYPRVGGGTSGAAPVFMARMGLSPRGRGNQNVPIKQDYGLGSIPAWAGEPRPLPCRKQRLRVYPRVGGGTAVYDDDKFILYGLSPRGRGNLVLKFARACD